MKLKTLIAGALLGAGLAFTSYQACPPEPKPKTLEVLVQLDTTNHAGRAFSGEQVITVFDRHRNAQAGLSIRLYQVHEGRGSLEEVYLAGTPSIGGGIAVYVHRAQEHTQRGLDFMITTAYAQTPPGISGNSAAPPPELGTSSASRELVIRPSSGVTIFDHDSQEAVYNLVSWTVDQEFHCDGISTTEQLIAGREKTIRLISYFDPTGLVQEAYDNVEWLIEQGILRDLPAGKEWFVLTPTNPAAPPLLIQRDLANQKYSALTVMRLEERCSGVSYNKNPESSRNTPPVIPVTPEPREKLPQPSSDRVNVPAERCPIPQSVARGDLDETLRYFELSSLEVSYVRRSDNDVLNEILIHPLELQKDNVFNTIRSKLRQELGSPTAQRNNYMTWFNGNRQGCFLVALMCCYAADGNIGIRGLEIYRVPERNNMPGPLPPNSQGTVSRTGGRDVCTPHASHECRPTNGNIIWKDSCGNWENDTYQRCCTGCGVGETSCYLPASPTGRCPGER